MVAHIEDFEVFCIFVASRLIHDFRDHDRPNTWSVIGCVRSWSGEWQEVVTVATTLVVVALCFPWKGGAEVLLETIIGELVVLGRAEVDCLAVVAEPESGDAVGVGAGSSEVGVFIVGEKTIGWDDRVSRDAVFGKVSSTVA